VQTSQSADAEPQRDLGDTDDRAPLSVGNDRDSPPRADPAPAFADALQPGSSLPAGKRKKTVGRHQVSLQTENEFDDKLADDALREATNDFDDFLREREAAEPATRPRSRRSGGRAGGKQRGHRATEPASIAPRQSWTPSQARVS